MKSICLFLLCVASMAQAAAPKEFAYGVHLYETGDYYRSISELERFRYFEPGSPYGEGALRLISAAYFKGEKWDMAARRYNDYLSAYPQSGFRDEAEFFLAEALYEGRDLKNADASYRGILHSSQRDDFVVTASLRLASLDIIADRWSQAEEDFKDLSRRQKDPELLKHLEDWERLSREGGSLGEKSAAVSVLSSALIPGMGQAYSGYTADGVSALLLVGGLASWAAFYAYNHQQTPELIFGAAAFVFYLGNLQGAYLAVRRSNRERPRAKEKEILDGIGALAPPEPDLSPYVRTPAD
jgi:hypothetical protein